MSHVQEQFPPKLRATLSDLPRAGVEASSLIWAGRSMLKRLPQGDGGPVMCISGYGGTDGSMLPLRRFMQKLGYTALKSNLGVNLEAKEDRIKSVDDALRFREKMVALLSQQVEKAYEEHQRPLTLIGWSMGGLFALDVSQQLPEKVNHVITLGAPFGDPRGTSMFKLLRFFSGAQVPIEEQNFLGWWEKHEMKHPVKVDVIYSPHDGIVGKDTAQLKQHPWVTHHKINSSHIGFAVNPKVFRKIALLLDLNNGKQDD